MVGNHNAVMLISASKSHEMPLQLDAVKKCFTGMMTTHRDDVKKELSKLVDRVKHMGEFNMRRVARKLVFGVYDQVRHKPGCTVIEDG